MGLCIAFGLGFWIGVRPRVWDKVTVRFGVKVLIRVIVRVWDRV